MTAIFLKMSNPTRNLGVTVDRNYTFSCHVNDICKKAFQSISTRGRIWKYLSGDALKRLTYALVLRICLPYGLAKSEKLQIKVSPKYRSETSYGRL